MTIGDGEGQAPERAALASSMRGEASSAVRGALISVAGGYLAPHLLLNVLLYVGVGLRALGSVHASDVLSRAAWAVGLVPYLPSRPLWALVDLAGTKWGLNAAVALSIFVLPVLGWAVLGAACGALSHRLAAASPSGTSS